MISRFFSDLSSRLQPNKVLVIYGPRRVGKTTLIENFLNETKLRYRYDSGENIEVQHVISSSDFGLIKEYCQGYELIVIDEAQNIPQVGKGLKIIVDQVPNIHVLVTGSSSFDLSNKVGEPLVGRQRIIKLFPISLIEMSKSHSSYDIKQNLNDWLIFGMYPEVITSTDKHIKTEYLSDLVNSFLLKDILALENVKSSRILMNLLRLLAYQVGSEVSLNELSNNLSIDTKTVGRYLDLLEKTFIIISIGGFSRNLRNEIVSKRKYYFADNGIRNALINSYNPLDMRDDVGVLWENFMFIERLKKKSYQGIYTNDYFWRTYAKAEIDLIEERDGKIFPFEFKWKNKKYKAPLEWSKNYPGTEVQVINNENFLDFVL
ncbi:MAG TPA: ATP-binding protein [Cyclobacteriaceae bacterium]|nr:ATP-binding protein [Cyclobacteriaceae bacterium]